MEREQRAGMIHEAGRNADTMKEDLYGTRRTQLSRQQSADTAQITPFQSGSRGNSGPELSARNWGWFEANSAAIEAAQRGNAVDRGRGSSGADQFRGICSARESGRKLGFVGGGSVRMFFSTNSDDEMENFVISVDSTLWSFFLSALLWVRVRGGQL
ncbi:hypothetical protein CRG98_024299 [Punica granatum]|uniref:Uncharacterized protein n=1 Tax=Punica granatum TaxID=22663 RepID=A0A2I0JH04_PUNGR|nr:hypothetical protein CRG98_024299 [Punica granatum]